MKQLCDLRDKCAVFVPLDVGTEQWKSAWGAYFTSRFSWPPFLLEIWPLSKEGWWNFGSEDSPRFYEEGNLVERLHLIDSVTWEAPSARSFFLRFRRGGTMSEVGEDEIDGLSEFDEYENIGEEFSPSELDGYQVLEGDGIVSGIDELEGEVDESGTLSELQEVVEN